MIALHLVTTSPPRADLVAKWREAFASRSASNNSFYRIRLRQKRGHCRQMARSFGEQVGKWSDPALQGIPEKPDECVAREAIAIAERQLMFLAD
jgi:hypothetical protein